MKEIIPYTKEIVFNTKVASINSISLEHEEKVFDGEVAGDFIIFGDYKAHNDTTETENFKYRLPFTTILPDNILKDSIKVDIENFTYELSEEDVLKVKIDFCVMGDEIEEERFKDLPDPSSIDEDRALFEEPLFNEDLDKEIDEFLATKEEDKKIDSLEQEEVTKEEINEKDLSIEEEHIETVDEYVTYHIHIVKESETIESIIKLYDTNLETIKLYNEIDKLKTGDKLVIPEYVDD